MPRRQSIRILQYSLTFFGVSLLRIRYEKNDDKKFSTYQKPVQIKNFFPEK